MKREESPYQKARGVFQIIPVTGYVDDLRTITAALSTIALYINSEVKAAAKQQVTEWFGDSGEGQGS